MALKRKGNKPDGEGYLILGLRNVVRGQDGKEWAKFKGSLQLPDGQSISVELTGVMDGDYLTMLPKAGRKDDNPVIILRAAHWVKPLQSGRKTTTGNIVSNRRAI